VLINSGGRKPNERLRRFAGQVMPAMSEHAAVCEKSRAVDLSHAAGARELA
jgi:hypothetical protein